MTPAHRRPADVAAEQITQTRHVGAGRMCPLNRTVDGTSAASHQGQVSGTWGGTSLPRGARQSSEVKGAGQSTVRWEGAEDDQAELSIVSMPVRRQNVRTPQPQECVLSGSARRPDLTKTSPDYATAFSRGLWRGQRTLTNRFTEEAVARGGKIAGGNALQGTDTVTSIRGDSRHRRPVRRDQGGASAAST